KKRIDFVEKFIQSHLKQIDNNKIILDMGCGDGVNLRWLSKYSQNLLAIDYNLLRLRRTRQLMRTLKVSAKLFLADIFYIPFANDSFDLIFFNHVIEHLNDDFLALKNIYRITKKGGIVILGTPNEGALSWGFAYWIEPMTRKKTDHVHFYTAKSISELALKAGFTIKHIEYMGWGIPIWSLDSRIRKYKIIDDLFELIGKRLFKSQSTSLYIILEKPI
ncbi:MAG: methyltransferase domain-containing protein, partial [Nitrosopumilaceae archaeon]